MTTAAEREILASLSHGAVVVTPHERSARFVRSRWDEAQRTQGLRSWPTASAMSWRAWATERWHALVRDGATDRILLHRTQELFLWRDVLARMPERFHASELGVLAQQCAQAHRSLADLDGLSKRLANIRVAGNHFFVRALNQLRQICEDRRWIPSAELEESLSTALRSGRAETNCTELVLCGFDELSPAQTRLLESWRERGGHAKEVNLAVLADSSSSFVCEVDQQEGELQAFAEWVREYLGQSPQARIGLVTNGLEERKEEIDAELRRSFAVEGDRSLLAEGAVSYEFSLGRALRTEPAVQIALDLLRWTQSSLPVETAGRVLLSTHFATSPATREKDLGQRSVLDREMRRMLHLRPEISLSEMASLASGRETGGAIRHALRQLLASDLAVQREGKVSRQLPSHWVSLVRSALGEAMWATAPSGRTFFVKQRWEALLDELWTLDVLGDTLTFAEFLHFVEEQLGLVVFAPESRDASVQVLGPLEAAGQSFDALWVLHCGDLEWPVTASPSSLITPALRRELGMPGTDRATDRRRAERITDRLARSASVSIFSYAKRSSDDAEQALASSVAALNLPLQGWRSTAATDFQPRVALERLEKEDTIAPLASRSVGGGARLLELQAACGFRSFAELRLQSREMESRSLGFSAADRGTVVHDALEYLWNEVRTHEVLLQLKDQQLQELIGRAADHGLRRATTLSKEAWDASYLRVQRDRLRTLLTSWLAGEASRPEFTTLAREIKLDNVPVGDLLLSVRVDRVDAVADGLVLLDYKTSKTTPSLWKGERPEKPQMLLYAALAARGYLDEHLGAEALSLAGVAFANVIAGPEMAFEGVQREGVAALPFKAKARHDSGLAELIPEWERVIDQLAAEFASGKATVDPANYPRTCERCVHRLLCRMDPELLAFSAASDDMDEAGAVDD